MENSVPATFLAWQDTLPGCAPLALWNLTAPLLGHPAGSTVCTETLRVAGYVVVEPTFSRAEQPNPMDARKSHSLHTLRELQPGRHVLLDPDDQECWEIVAVSANETAATPPARAKWAWLRQGHNRYRRVTGSAQLRLLRLVTDQEPCAPGGEEPVAETARIERSQADVPAIS